MTISQSETAQTPVDASPSPQRAVTNYTLVPVVIVATCVSIASFFYFFNREMTNCYGDGVAHVNIARKVVDSPDHSLWQRYIQIGSPWLPLQTVMMLPLVRSDWMWRTGAAGSFVSMISFIICAGALYLLATDFYADIDTGRFALLAAVIFALNPSAIYLQTTPMTEMVFMAALVVAVYLLQRWALEQSKGRLAIAAVAMAIATLSRYEAWPVALAGVFAVLAASDGNAPKRLLNAALFSVLTAIGPLYWLWHNWAIYGNGLEFLTGPNSARAIYLQNEVNLGWSRIFVGHAALDALTMLVTTAVCAGPVLVFLALTGFFVWMVTSIKKRTFLKRSPALLLLVPFLFHIWSMYRGEIQVFPVSAFGLLNARYGLPHLLAVALFAPSLCLMFKESRRGLAAAILCVVVIAQYGYLISEGPAQLAVYQEGYRNGINGRIYRERATMAKYLVDHSPQPVILMQTGSLGPLVSKGGLRFSNIIHEGTARWHQINDSIPDDVTTVIVQEGDVLDLRVRNNPALMKDLEEKFEEEMTAGNIRLFRRR